MATLRKLGDRALLKQLDRLVDQARCTTADVVAHVAEVERRELHLKQGYSSMYRYLTEKLGFAEGAAYRRLKAARLSRRFPEVLRLIRLGSLHLSGLAVLAPILTAENHRELLYAARGRSKRSIEHLVATLRPRPDAPDSVRKLPTRSHALPTGSPGASLQESISGSARSAVANLPTSAEAQPTTAMQPTALPFERSQSPSAGPLFSGRRAPGPIRPVAASVTPLAADRYKVQFTASPSTVRKLDTARRLLSHRIPNGDLDALFDRALSLLCETLEKQRFGKTSRSRKRSSGGSEPKPPAIMRDTTDPGVSRPPKSGERVCVGSPEVQAEQADLGECSAPAKERPSRHIPNSIRRAVFERDQGRCRFVGADGRRCGEQHLITFHHVEPWARNGRHRLDEIVLMCQPHNQLLARRDFGARAVDEAIVRARDGRRP